MQIPWKRLVQVLVLLLALGFLAALVRSQWSALRSYPWQLSPGWALLGLAGLEIAWLFELDTWRMVLCSLGGALPYRRAATIWFLSNIIRYIPGNVWQFLGMAEMAAEEGVSRLVTLTSIVLHQVISTAAGLTLAALYFAAAGQQRFAGAAWLLRLQAALWLTPLGLLLLQPRLLERLLNRVMTLLGRPPLTVTLTWAQVWLLLLRYTIVWLVMGLSYTALVRSLTPLAAPDVLFLVAAWAAAYVVGYLSLLTPSGLGVREAVMVVLLAAVVPEPIPAVTAIAARLWMVVGELVGAGVAVAITMRDSRSRGISLVRTAKDRR